MVITRSIAGSAGNATRSAAPMVWRFSDISQHPLRDGAESYTSRTGFGCHGSGLGLDRQPLKTATDSCPCGRETRLGAFADQLTFEFGQRGVQIEHKATLCVGGVDRIVETLQVDLARRQFTNATGA